MQIYMEQIAALWFPFYFHKMMISSNQHEFIMGVDKTGKIYKFQSTVGRWCRSVMFYTLSDIHYLDELQQDCCLQRGLSPHGFKRTQTVMRMSSSHWWEVSQHFIHTNITLKTLPIWTGHQHNSNSRERSVSILLGRKLCHSNKKLPSNS